MDKVIASKNFIFGDTEYLKGEVVKVKTYEQVVKLNTFGFIEPLKFEDLVLIKRELQNKNKKNKEVEYEL